MMYVKPSVNCQSVIFYLTCMILACLSAIFKLYDIVLLAYMWFCWSTFVCCSKSHTGLIPCLSCFIYDVKWASSWENLLLPYANNKGADQPAYLRSLISPFVARCLDSIIPLVFISEISSFYLASVAAQASLSLPWSETPKTGFLVTRLK